MNIQKKKNRKKKIINDFNAQNDQKARYTEKRRRNKKNCKPTNCNLT